MHKIQAKEFTLEDFSCEHLEWTDAPEECYEAGDILDLTIKVLNVNRHQYLETKDKKYWWQMIQLLPDSYNQLRTCDTNYATLRKMYHQRKGHKLDEWTSFNDWVETLPYSELITTEE